MGGDSPDPGRGPGTGAPTIVRVFGFQFSVKRNVAAGFSLRRHRRDAGATQAVAAGFSLRQLE